MHYLCCYILMSVVVFELQSCMGMGRHDLLHSARQHPSYGDCLEVKREYYQNCSVLDCLTQNLHTPQHTYMSNCYRFNKLGLAHWDPYAVRRGSCLDLYNCNMVEWFWWF